MGLGQSTKSILKRALPHTVLQTARAARRTLGLDFFPAVPFDNTYAWLNYAFLRIMRHGKCADKPMYVWGILQGAALAKVLGFNRISVIEFGVAGGFGLLSAEATAHSVERLIDIQIDVFGFDTGVGLPKPMDVRDQPNMWFEGQLPMDKPRLESALTKAKLVIGPVSETLPSFMQLNPAPIGFVSIDVDLYSSTVDALGVFQAGDDRLLPRVITYFDDINGHTYNEFCGERLAINEFNSSSSARKICPIHGLRYFLPRNQFQELWVEGMYWAHLFEHPLYSQLDSYNKAVSADITGTALRVRPDSEWR